MSYSTFLYFKFFHKYILCHIENERRYTCQPVFLSILSIITEPMSLLSFVSLKHTPNSATLKKRATVTSLVVIRSNVLLICQWVFNLSEMVIFLMIYICCHFFFLSFLFMFFFLLFWGRQRWFPRSYVFLNCNEKIRPT